MYLCGRQHLKGQLNDTISLEINHYGVGPLEETTTLQNHLCRFGRDSEGQGLAEIFQSS